MERLNTSVEREQTVTEQDSSRTATLAELCQEAVQRFGGDWERIRAYVAERIAQLPGEDRKRLIEDVDRLLAFCAPSRPGVLH